MELLIRHLLNDLFLLFTFICPGTLLVGGILLISKFAKNDRMSHFWISIPSILSILFAAIFLLLVIFDSSGFIRFIFTGALILVTAISVLVAIIQGIRQRHILSPKTRIFYTLGILFALLSSRAGWLGAQAVINQCESSHVKTGDMIVRALEDYFRTRHQYPDNLSELMPQFISNDSIRTCYNLHLDEQNPSATELSGFYYKKCSLGTTQLSIPEMGTGHFHIYDLNAKQWYTSRGDTLEEWDRVTRCQDYE